MSWLARVSDGRQPRPWWGRQPVASIAKKFAPGLLSLLGLALILIARDDSSLGPKAWHGVSLRQLSSSNQDGPRTEKVAFMFLTEQQGIVQEEVWENWLKGHEDKASVYVHVTEPNAHRTSSKLGMFFERRIIPSVPTLYSRNLFDAMMQLLLHAHADGENVRFVYISSNAIPVRTFEETYAELVGGGSRVCFGPKSWSTKIWKVWESIVPDEPLEISEEYRVGSELWSSLSREHAHMLVSNLELGGKLLMRSLKTVGTGLPGVPDEMILPTILRWQTHLNGREPEDGFNTCHGSFSVENSFQGCCAMYVRWDDRHPGSWANGVVMPSMKHSGFFKPHPSRPCVFNHVTEEDIREVAAAGFLFLRKVKEDTKIMRNQGTDREELVPLKDELSNVLARNAKQTSSVK